MGTAVRRTVHVHVQVLRKYQVYAVYFYCYQTTLGHGTRGTQWLWSRYFVQACSKILLNQGLLEPEAAFCSKEVTRATRIPTICSIIVILVVWAATCLSKRLDAIFDPSRVLYEER